LLAVTLATALFLAFAVVAVDKSIRRGDIAIFFEGGRAIIEDRDPYAASCVGCGFINPPYFALLMVPFAAAPRVIAATVWFLLNFASLVLLFATALYLLERPGVGIAPWLRAKLSRLAKGKLNIFVVAAAVITAPLWYENLTYGQINIHICTLSLLGVYFATAGSFVVGGALLGAAFAPKLFAVPVLLYLFIKREYRAAACALLVAGALFVAPAALLGWGRNAALLQSWYDNVIGPAKGLAFVYGGDFNISLIAVIYRLCRSLGLDDSALIYRRAFNLNTLNWVLAALLLSPLAVSILRGRGRDAGGGRASATVEGLRLSFIIVTGLLLLPFAWAGYYVAAVLPVMAIVYALRETPSRTARAICAGLLVLFFAAFGCFASTDIWGEGKAVFYRYGLITAGGLFLYAAITLLLFSPRLKGPAGAAAITYSPSRRPRS
jgi:hypothetical protein